MPRKKPSTTYSPRIRGDGPTVKLTRRSRRVFSPYSRGWSHPPLLWPLRSAILPVFAGMVPSIDMQRGFSTHSPRIRGDGPVKAAAVSFVDEILPVFAGMVPGATVQGLCQHYSPRIRGDGPSFATSSLVLASFSPYSRGWSHDAAAHVHDRFILPVFAGMVPEHRAAQ